MVQAGLDHNWQPASVPFAYLTEQTGEYVGGSLEDLASLKLPSLRWDGDNVLVATDRHAPHLLVDLQGRVVARVPAYPRPGTTDHVTLERIGVSDARLRLERADGSLVAATSVMGDSAGQYGARSMAWSPSGRRFVLGAFQYLYCVTIDPVEVSRWEVSRGSIDCLLFLAEDCVAFVAGTTLKVFDVARGSLLREKTDNRFLKPWGLLCSPDGTELLVGGRGLTRVRADALEDCVAIELPSSRKQKIAPNARPLAFSSDGSLLLATSEQSLVLIEWPSAKVVATLGVGSHPVQSGALSVANDHIAVAGSGALQFWRRGGHTSAGMAVPQFQTRSVAAVRRTESPFPRNVEELDARMLEFVSFGNLGKPSQYDDALTRILGFEEWPGPEDERAVSLTTQLQTWIDASQRALLAGGLDIASAKPLLERLRLSAERSLTLSKAEEDDPYAPRYACLTQLELVVRTTAAFLVLGWPVPEDLRELFLLYEAGHWPCGYAEGIGGASDPVKLLVL